MLSSIAIDAPVHVFHVSILVFVHGLTRITNIIDTGNTDLYLTLRVLVVDSPWSERAEHDNVRPPGTVHGFLPEILLESAVLYRPSNFQSNFETYCHDPHGPTQGCYRLIINDIMHTRGKAV